MPKLRLDHLLLSRNLVPTREKAQFLIMTGQVLVNDIKITKSGQAVSEDSNIRILIDLPKYVSRGGLKLEGAWKTFEFDIAGRHAIDVGISTGGFTDFLLHEGAGSVIGLDVGYGQVNLKVRNDPRVAVFERQNVRTLTTGQLNTMMMDQDTPPHWLSAADLVVMDVSFISVTKVLPAVRTLVPHGDYIILIKPQFEAERSEVGKGGIVRDPAIISTILERVKAALADNFELIGECESPITGAKGNQEHFFWLKPKGD
ncbi:TlyA family RNA methyltransferase [bacterium]|nr:TlyA family RNA methyltransferase [bacterium]